MIRGVVKYLSVALSVAGSAILLFSCDTSNPDPDPAAYEKVMTEYSENLAIVMSQNGQRSYFFKTPQVEGYMLAREPYREFRKGISITTYKNDSLSEVDAVLTANYAIYYEKRQLWEAKGNVVVEKSDGTEFYSQQLFWNARTKKIYSNVDSKLVKNEGRDVFIGEGFESDEEFKDWRFRRMKGRMEVTVQPSEEPDSVVRARRAGRNPIQEVAPQSSRQDSPKNVVAPADKKESYVERPQQQPKQPKNKPLPPRRSPHAERRNGEFIPQNLERSLPNLELKNAAESATEQAVEPAAEQAVASATSAQPSQDSSKRALRSKTNERSAVLQPNQQKPLKN